MADSTSGTTSSSALQSHPVPGDIQILSCSLINSDGKETQDIRLLVKEFSLYQSIFTDHVRGEILIEDALALTTRMPIVGEEKINLSFKTPHVSGQTNQNNPVSFNGMVTKSERQHFFNVRSVSYLLTFVSAMRIADLMRVVRDPFGPGTISEFVQKVAKDYYGLEGDKIEIEQTTGQHKFVIPSWSPSQTMRFFCREAISPSGKASNYLFWEDTEKAHFKTLESLIGNPEDDNPDKPENTYYFTEQSLLNKPGTTTAQPGEFRSNPKEWRYIHHLDVQQTFDVENALTNGLFDNKVLWVDTLLQQYESVKVKEGEEVPHWRYLRDFSTTRHLGPKPFSSPADDAEKAAKGEGRAMHCKGSGDSHIRFLHANPKQTWEKFQVTPRKRQDKLPYLISSMEQLGYVAFNMTVHGDTNRKPGDVITIALPEFGATDDVLTQQHRYLKGRWLVTAVRHRYTFNAGFFTILEICKNALMDEIKAAPGGKS